MSTSAVTLPMRHDTTFQLLRSLLQAYIFRSVIYLYKHFFSTILQTSFRLLLVVYLFKIKFSVPLFNFNHSVFECNAENIYIHKSVNDMGKQFISECFQITCPFVMVTQTT